MKSIVAPLNQAAASPASTATKRATSSSVDSRRAGIARSSTRRSRRTPGSPNVVSSAGVITAPNLSRFTRWPRGPSSCARCRTYTSSAALVAAISAVLRITVSTIGFESPSRWQPGASRSRASSACAQ